MSDWIKLENVTLDKSVTSIHVDTRDFYAIVSTDVGIPDDLRKLLNRLKDKDQYLIKESELIDFLISMRTRTGGEVDWRYIELPRLQGWLKYLRIYRVNPQEFIIGHELNHDRRVAPMELQILKELKARYQD